MSRLPRGSSGCAATAVLWVVLLVAAKFVDGGSRLPTVLLLFGGFVSGWMTATLMDARWRRGSGTAQQVPSETVDHE